MRGGILFRGKGDNSVFGKILIDPLKIFTLWGTVLWYIALFCTELFKEVLILWVLVVLYLNFVYFPIKVIKLYLRTSVKSQLIFLILWKSCWISQAQILLTENDFESCFSAVTKYTSSAFGNAFMTALTAFGDTKRNSKCFHSSSCRILKKYISVTTGTVWSKKS